MYDVVVLKVHRKKIDYYLDIETWCLDSVINVAIFANKEFDFDLSPANPKHESTSIEATAA